MTRAALLSNLAGLARDCSHALDARLIAADLILMYLADAEIARAYREIPCSTAL